MRDDPGTAVSTVGVVSPGLEVMPIGSCAGSEPDRRDRCQCEGRPELGLLLALGAPLPQGDATRPTGCRMLHREPTFRFDVLRIAEGLFVHTKVHTFAATTGDALKHVEALSPRKDA
jgi:hypothetical protein